MQFFIPTKIKIAISSLNRKRTQKYGVTSE